MNERAVILAGGEGRRLSPYTAILPKPLMPLFENTSIIEHVLCGIASAGITDVTITLGYLGHLIEAVVGNGERFGLQIDYTREEHPLGTAGPLSLLSGVSPEDRILVVNGDTFTDLDYGLVLNLLEEPIESVVVCVNRVIETNYGVVQFDGQGLLTNWEEKPQLQMTVSTGIYGIKGSALDLLEVGQRTDMPDLLRSLNLAGRRVACLLAECQWKDLGRPEDFAAMNSDRAAEMGAQGRA